MAKFRPNVGKFWPKREFFKFPQKNKAVIFFWLQRLGFLQKIRKFQCAVFGKNAKNTHFRVFWAKKANFGPFVAKKRKRHFFTHFLVIFQYKKSENSNTRIFGKMGTYGRTHGRTEANPKVHRLCRETKKEGKNLILSHVKRIKGD